MFVSLFNLNFSPSALSGPAWVGIVALTGFLDGIHPCAIAILIFFLAFLLSLQRQRKEIFLLGWLYIGIIFLTYWAIGLGFLSGMMLFGQHHFFAKLGAILLFILGLNKLRHYFFPRLKINFPRLHLPRERIRLYLRQATVPAVIGAAFLVGLCSVPCSGGVYAAITALLASRQTFFRGALYLLLYNLMFVSPLIILLLLSTNPLLLVRLGEWQQRQQRRQLLVSGIFLILTALLISWFIF